MVHGGRLIIKLSVVVAVIIIVVVVVAVVITWLTIFGQGDTGMDDFGERMRQCWSL